MIILITGVRLTLRREKALFFQKLFNLSGNVLTGESQFLIQHTVWGRKAEALHAKYFYVLTGKPVHSDRQPGSEAEEWYARGNNAVAVALILVTEHSF